MCFREERGLSKDPIYLWIRQPATELGSKGMTGLATGDGKMSIGLLLYRTSWFHEEERVIMFSSAWLAGGGTLRAPIIRSLIGRGVPNGMGDAGTARAGQGRRGGTTLTRE
jgi:hypothetical protein